MLQLSGESQGWTTHEVDLTGFMDDYVQIGMNSVYSGGNRHPYSSSFYYDYYMVTDRMNVELTDDAGNSWNITSTTHDGYYDGSLGGDSGIPSHNCQSYGYTRNPTASSYSTGKPAGWGWVATDTSQTGNRWPTHHWGYWSSASSSQWQAAAPPEGLTGTYNVCMHEAYYSNPTGASVRMTMPVVDLSALNNITGVKAYIDVYHKGADNFQDRLEWVARSGDDPSSLGDYSRVNQEGLYSALEQSHWF